MRMWLVAAIVVALQVPVAAQAAPSGDQADTATTPVYSGGWQTLASIPGGPRQEHATVSVRDKVYVIGGVLPPADAVGTHHHGGEIPTTGRVQVYDTRTGSWSEAAPLPVPLNHPNAAVVGDKIYVLGGLAGGQSWQAVGDSFVYNPRTDTWTALAPMPTGTERGSAAMGTRGTKIYLAGGMRTLTPAAGGLQDTVDTVSSYDVVTRRWTALPSLPEARDHVGGAVIGTTLYVVGGRDRGQANVRDTVYALNLLTRQWSTRAPMPTARGGLATAFVGTTIYTFGGEGNKAPGSNGVFPDTEAYDTVRDRWVKLAPMPVPRHGTAATAVGSTIHIPGGGTSESGVSMVDTHDAYRPHGQVIGNSAVSR